jgi:hypothetical protein
MEPVVCWSTGHDGIPPDGNLMVLFRVDGHVVLEPLGKIAQNHGSVPYMKILIIGSLIAYGYFHFSPLFFRKFRTLSICKN